MNDRDGAGAAEAEQAEDELRALLERAVPQPPAPPQRLERVRERVRRRRRRRTALVTGSALLAVAAGLLAVPGLVRPQGGGRAAPTVAAGGPDAGRTARGPATSAPAPTPTPQGGYAPDGMGGLRLDPPQGWHFLPDPATTSIFLSTQDLVLPQNGCAHALDGFCTPLARVLAKGGTLVMFRLEQFDVQAGKLHDLEVPLEDEEAYASCRAVNGTRQVGRTMVGATQPDTVVWAVACLSHPSPAQLERARSLLASAVIG